MQYTPKFLKALHLFGRAVNRKLREVHSEELWVQLGGFRSVKLEAGRKFIKVIRRECCSNSVVCFIDLDGNIYKPASWKVPAKGIRGSIYSDYTNCLARAFYL